MKNNLNIRLKHWSTTISTQENPDASNVFPQEQNPHRSQPERNRNSVICQTSQSTPSTPSQTLRTLKSALPSEPMLTRSADSSRPLNGIARLRGTRIPSTTGCLTLLSTGSRRSRNQPPSGKDTMTANAFHIAIATFLLSFASVSLGYWFGSNARGVEEQGARIEYVDKTTAYASVQPKGGKFSF